MDLNRLKKNLKNRDWSSKTKQSKINYIKGKLKQFGLNIPNYLNHGKLAPKSKADFAFLQHMISHMDEE